MPIVPGIIAVGMFALHVGSLIRTLLNWRVLYCQANNGNVDIVSTAVPVAESKPAGKSRKAASVADNGIAVMADYKSMTLQLLDEKV